MVKSEAEDFDISIGGDIEPGVYPATLIDLKRTEPMATQYSDDEEVFFRWVWGIDLPDGSATELDELSSRSTSPRSKNGQIKLALLGADGWAGTHKRSDLVGRMCLLTIGRSDDGFARIEGHTALPAKK